MLLRIVYPYCSFRVLLALYHVASAETFTTIRFSAMNALQDVSEMILEVAQRDTTVRDTTEVIHACLA